MDSHDVEWIKNIVQAELVPALKLVEDRLMTTLTHAINGFESQIGSDHAENRTRMQFIDAGVAKTSAQNEFIIKNQEEQKKDLSEQKKLIQDVLITLSKREGQEGADAKNSEKQKAIIKAGFAVVGSGGLIAGWHWLTSFIKKW